MLVWHEVAELAEYLIPCVTFGNRSHTPNRSLRISNLDRKLVVATFRKRT